MSSATKPDRAAKCRNAFYRRAARGEPLDDVLIIDHHGHLGAFWSPPLEEEVTEIADVMTALHVDRGVAFAVGHEDYRGLNDMIWRGVSMRPDKLLAYTFIYMDSPDAVHRELERCFKMGMKGLKLHSGYDNGVPITDPSFEIAWDFCAEHGWPVIVHGNIMEVARKHPGTVFIGAHQITHVHNPEFIRMIQDCPNAFIGTSDTLTEMGAIEKAVELVGSDRLLFGSDFPGNNMAVRLGAVLTARITEEEMRNILGLNIARILKLETGEGE